VSRFHPDPVKAARIPNGNSVAGNRMSAPLVVPAFVATAFSWSLPRSLVCSWRQEPAPVRYCRSSRQRLARCFPVLCLTRRPAKILFERARA